MDIQLISRIHALPPELYNQIRDEVLAIQTPNKTHVIATYKFPYNFHLNKASRKHFVTSYLNQVTFVCTSWDVLKQFLAVLRSSQLQLSCRFEMIHFGRVISAHLREFEILDRVAGRHFRRRAATWTVKHHAWAAQYLAADGFTVGRRDIITVWELRWRYA